MKLKDVNLNIPHYVVAINTATNHILAAKTKYSTLEKSKNLIWSPRAEKIPYFSVADQFFIYPHLQDRDTYVEKPIVSLSANPEEEIYVGGHYIRFNLNYKHYLNYIAFDLATMKQLIHDYFKKKYNIVRQTEGVVYRNGYSKDIQGMYIHYLNQIKKYLM
jgi:hypothetical protein